MMLPLAAAGLQAAPLSRTYYGLARLQNMTHWWHWMLLLLVCLGILAWVTFVYRRDSSELPRGLRGLLLLLRLTALLGLLLFFLDLEKRTEQKLVKTSHVAVLVDTSQSMGLADAVDNPATTETRLAQVARELAQSDLMQSLRAKHDVTCYRFDQSATPEPIASFTKQAAATAQATASTYGLTAELNAARWLYGLAFGLLVCSLLALAAHGLLGRRWRGREGEAWWLLASGLSLVVAIVLTAVTHLRHPQLSPREILRGAPVAIAPAEVPSAAPDAAPVEAEPAVDWAAQLVARGSETRLGDALRWIVDKERGGPLAGVVVISDGRNNGGVDPGLSASLAQEAEIPLYPVGVGSDRSPQNVRVVDLEAPPRVYPGDGFTITAYLQASGFKGRSVTLDLLSTADAANAPEVSQEQRRLDLPEDGQILPVKFEITPDAVGRRQWILRVAAPPEDLEPSDNQRTASVEVVERKNHVLLVSGGPQREYHFLRNLLFRDANTTLDVLLQSAPAGAAQESHAVLRGVSCRRGSHVRL